MNINLIYDLSVNNAPSAFQAALTAVVQWLDTTFTNPITINVNVGYGEIAGQTMASGALGESSTNYNSYSYAQIRTALAQNATSADQIAAVGTLPTSAPTNGGNYWLATANAKALGLMGASSALDAYVGFSSTFPFTYDDSNGVAAGTYDFYGVAMHELTETMGRSLFVGTDGIGANAYTSLDLFHYSGNGSRDFVGTTPGYFSIDGGKTNLDNFNTNPGGDFGDWASSAGRDSFLAFSSSGVVNAVTQTDVRVMNVLGYNESGPSMPPVAGPFVGDFDGNHNSDILWQSANGTPTMWLMSGTSVASSTALPAAPSGCQLAGIGDFNGDGKSDILWANASSTTMWVMNGSSVSSVATMPGGGTWHIVGTGDFNGDGKSDILWMNSDTTPGLWLMNGSSIVSAAAFSPVGPSWHIVGTGDFNGDGNSDILWFNSDNTPGIWEMNGGSLVSAFGLSTAGPEWRLVGAADVNGDGKSDLLWQNSNDGSVGVWEMNGGTLVAAALVGNPGLSWQLSGAGDFNSDGKSDLIFKNPTTNQVQIWLMNGTQVQSMQAPMSIGLSSSAAAPLSGAPVLSEPEAFAAPGTETTVGGAGGSSLADPQSGILART